MQAAAVEKTRGGRGGKVEEMGAAGFSRWVYLWSQHGIRLLQALMSVVELGRDGVGTVCNDGRGTRWAGACAAEM